MGLYGISKPRACLCSHIEVINMIPMTFLNNYTFADITIWCKCNKKDECICLTDWQPCTHEDPLIYESNEKYLVALFSPALAKHYVSPISISELFELAGLKDNTNFQRQIHIKVEDDSASAMLLAKKISQTNSFNTKCQITKNNDKSFNCEFKRRKTENNQRGFVTLFTKTLVASDKEN